MNKTAVYGFLLVALGLAAGVSLAWWGERDPAPAAERPGDTAFLSEPGFAARPPESLGDPPANRLERRLDLLTAKLDAEASARRRLEDQLAQLTTELAGLRGGHPQSSGAAAKSESATAAVATKDVTTDGTDAANAAPRMTTMEHALVAAGVDATTAAEIKRRGDELTLSEIYLRDQAAREGWLNTPRFNQELADIQRQRTSIRDQIGDDAYDRYLAALDQPNQVAIHDVLADSPAQAAGLQAGDVVLRYGETRIFAPNELVNATRGGVAGENVPVEILRNGQRLEIDVPRGPLGVHIAASRGAPAGG